MYCCTKETKKPSKKDGRAGTEGRGVRNKEGEFVTR